MIRRWVDHDGNYQLYCKISDLPSFRLGDERNVFFCGGVTAGLVLGGIITSFFAKRRVNDMRRLLITARNEADTTRKIAQNDMASVKQYGLTSVFKDLLHTCDNMDRALDASSDVSSATSIEGLTSGVEMTRKELLKTMAQYGVTAIPVKEGDPFNPDLCEAVMSLHILPEKDEVGKDKTPVAGTVGAVIQPGYVMHDRVIRPVKVGVYRNDVFSLK